MTGQSLINLKASSAGGERERGGVKVLVEFVKSLVHPVVTLLRGGNEKHEARRFTETQKQRPQDYAMYIC